MRKIIGMLNLVIVIVVLVAFIMPAIAIFPVVRALKYPQTVWSDMGRTGAVTGRVTLATGGTVGIGGAYIAVVDATNVSREYWNTTSDAYGNYQVIGLNATYSSVLLQGPTGSTSDYTLGQNMYKIYANKTPYGEGYSAAFGIDANQTKATTTSVIIFTRPARIELSAERCYVLADGLDNITITATMYDALGNPVADGYSINFTVGNVSNNAWNGGFPWTTLDGSLNGAGNRDAIDQYTRDNSGIADVQFGWAPHLATGNESTIWAYYNDDPGVSASLTVSFLPTALRNVAMVSDTIPTTMTAGQHYKVSVTVKDTGTMNWTRADKIWLGGVGGATGNASMFGGYKYYIARGVTVYSGDTYTFNFTMTAPKNTGTYNVSYRMVQDGRQWFGDTLSKTITVN